MAFKDCANDPGYLPASFQGLTFYIESATLTVNPGSATAEFPYRTQPASIDTAKKADEYSLEGWITGQDVRAQVVAFRAAAAAGQPYTLVHPTFGPLIAGAKSIKFNEDFIKESGVCKFSFEGFEWGALPDAGGGFGAGAFFGAIEVLIATAGTSFLSRYTPSMVPAYLRGEVESTFNTTVGAVNRAVAAVGAPSGISHADWYDPRAAWTALSVPLVDFGDISASGAKSMARLVKTLAISVAPGPAQNSTDAILHSTRLLAIVALGNAALGGDYLTSGQACDARDGIIKPLDAEHRAASVRGDINVMREIDAYRRSFLTLITQEIASRPPVTTFDFPATTNSIKIAHELYGDASRFREIEHLNRHLLPSLMKGRVFALAS